MLKNKVVYSTLLVIDSFESLDLHSVYHSNHCGIVTTWRLFANVTLFDFKTPFFLFYGSNTRVQCTLHNVPLMINFYFFHLNVLHSCLTIITYIQYNIQYRRYTILNSIQICVTISHFSNLFIFVVVEYGCLFIFCKVHVELTQMMLNDNIKLQHAILFYDWCWLCVWCWWNTFTLLHLFLCICIFQMLSLFSFFCSS